MRHIVEGTSEGADLTNLMFHTYNCLSKTLITKKAPRGADFTNRRQVLYVHVHIFMKGTWESADMRNIMEGT